MNYNYFGYSALYINIDIRAHQGTKVSVYM